MMGLRQVRVSPLNCPFKPHRMLRTIIIDDEKKSRQSLKALLLNYCHGVDVVGLATGVSDGISCIDKYQPDLVMLDIQMQDGTGFDLLMAIPDPSFQVIFTTAYNEYAIKAFKFSAIDYLLKPIDLTELKAAIEKAKTMHGVNTRRPPAESMVKDLLEFIGADRRITISTEHALEILPVPDIIRLESDGNYTHFIMKDDRRIVSSKHLKHYDALLNGQQFMRVHNSHIVNLKCVSRYVKTDGGAIVLTNGDNVPISRRRKDDFLDIYKGQ